MGFAAVLDFRLIFRFPRDLPAGSLKGKLNQGRLQMYLTRRIDVVAIFAAFAFVGAILLGMI